MMIMLLFNTLILDGNLDSGVVDITIIIMFVL